MDNTIKVLDETMEHCDFLSTCHYVEAENNKGRRIRYGLPALIINIIVGSVLVADLGQIVSDVVKWSAAILALVSSFLVGIQTFFGFDKAERGHRQLGNKFNRTCRSLARLKASFLDKTLDAAEFSKRFEQLMTEYEEVCKENEDTPPSRKTAIKLKKQFESKSPQANKTIERTGAPCLGSDASGKPS